MHGRIIMQRHCLETTESKGENTTKLRENCDYQKTLLILQFRCG